MAEEAKASPTGDSAPIDKKLVRVLVAFVIVVSLPVLALAFRPAASTSAMVAPGTGFTDDFNRVDLGLNYFSTGAYWRIVNGELLSPGAKNEIHSTGCRAALPEERPGRLRRPLGRVRMAT